MFAGVSGNSGTDDDDGTSRVWSDIEKEKGRTCGRSVSPKASEDDKD